MHNFDSLISHLKNKLNESLPGLDAQLKMAPITRLEELNRKSINYQARQSAVLVLFYPVNDEIKIVFIKRPIDESVHSGQIAFPGGRVEEEDKDLIETALREANEEVNIDPEYVKVLGSLTKLHIPPSNFDVFPIVGYCEDRPDFSGNSEVDKILEISVHELKDPGTKTTKTIHHRLDKLVDVPCYYVQNQIIWGATAMMLEELLEITNY